MVESGLDAIVRVVWCRMASWIAHTRVVREPRGAQRGGILLGESLLSFRGASTSRVRPGTRCAHSLFGPPPDPLIQPSAGLVREYRHARPVWLFASTARAHFVRTLVFIACASHDDASRPALAGPTPRVHRTMMHHARLTRGLHHEQVSASRR